MKRAIVIGIYNLYDQARAMLASLRANSSPLYDLIVFHDNLTSGQQSYLQHHFGCGRFIEYTNFKGLSTGGEFGNLFSHMTMARYECFSLLAKYDQVLWLDIDLIVRKNLDMIFNHKKGMSATKEGVDLRMNFKDYIIPPLVELSEDERKRFFNAGVLLLNNSIPRYEEVKNWCDKETKNNMHRLRFPDQGILNLAVYKFGIPFEPLDISFNYSINYKNPPDIDPVIYHFFSSPKPWDKTQYAKAESVHGRKWCLEWSKWNEQAE